jgi:hypothetical protein
MVPQNNLSCFKSAPRQLLPNTVPNNGGQNVCPLKQTKCRQSPNKNPKFRGPMKKSDMHVSKVYSC